MSLDNLNSSDGTEREPEFKQNMMSVFGRNAYSKLKIEAINK